MGCENWRVDTRVGDLARLSLVGCAVETAPIADSLASWDHLSGATGLGHTRSLMFTGP